MAVYRLSLSVYWVLAGNLPAQPEQFDGAYLLKRYASEYDIPGIPRLVKKTVIPLTYFIGKLLGKYKHFKNAPEPVKNYVNYYL